MEIAGKTLRRRLLAAAVLFVALLGYDYVTGSTVNWPVTLLVPVLFLFVSIATDAAVQRWLDGER